MSQFPASFEPTEEDIAKMLACQLHIGTRSLQKEMGRYVYKRRQDGIYLIDLRKTWEKILFAARVIVAVENPADVVVISARPWGQRAALKFARYTGARAIAGRFTPGMFTNRVEKTFLEPRLLVVCDPFTDAQPVREASYVNVPTIAFCHTDSPTRHVDVAIPVNNKAKFAIGLMWWMLAREVLRIRNPASDRTVEWNEMVDMFLYRDPEEQEKAEAELLAQEEAAAAAASGPPAAAFSAEEYAGAAPGAVFAEGATPAASADWQAGAADETWEAATGGTQEWGAPTPEWDNAAGAGWDGK